jgi:hypothetical protein
MKRPHPGDWRPPGGLYQRFEISDAKLLAIGETLELSLDSEKRDVLRKGIEELAIKYLYDVEAEAEPSPSWYLEETNKILVDAERLSKTLSRIGGMARSKLDSRFRRISGIGIFAGLKPGELSLDEILKQLTRACEQARPEKDEIVRGRPKTSSVRNAVASAINLYLIVTESQKFELSFGKNAVTQEFTSRPARFLAAIFNIIDPAITNDMIANHARQTPRKREGVDL